MTILLGDHLEEKYNAATRVKTTRRGRLKVKRKDSKIPTANELVFLKRSPDYCHQNGTIGSLGKTCQLNNILKVFSHNKNVCNLGLLKPFIFIKNRNPRSRLQARFERNGRMRYDVLWTRL